MADAPVFIVHYPFDHAEEGYNVGPFATAPEAEAFAAAYPICPDPAFNLAHEDLDPDDLWAPVVYSLVPPTAQFTKHNITASEDA